MHGFSDTLSSVNYSDIEKVIRERALEIGGPVWGWQARVARELGVPPQYLAQMLGGDRRIAPEHVAELAEKVGLELTVQPKRHGQAPPPQPAPMDDESRAWLTAELAPPLEPYDWGDADPHTLGEPLHFTEQGWVED